METVNFSQTLSEVIIFVCYLLFVICYLLFVICYLLFVICYLLFVICYLLFVICYLLFVICFVLFCFVLFCLYLGLRFQSFCGFIVYNFPKQQENDSQNEVSDNSINPRVMRWPFVAQHLKA